MALTKRPLFDPPIVQRAVRDALAKTVNLRHMIRNPVMFVVLVGSMLTTAVLARDVVGGALDTGFTLQLALWLWFTVVFANFAEAMAEGRGKAQADTLRKSRTQTSAKRLRDPAHHATFESIPADDLRKGDVVVCMPGDMIPGSTATAARCRSPSRPASRPFRKAWRIRWQWG